MLIFMDLDSVNFRALQCGYNDVSDGNLTYTDSFINRSDKEGMNYNRFYKYLFPYSVPTIIPIFLKFYLPSTNIVYHDYAYPMYVSRYDNDHLCE